MFWPSTEVETFGVESEHNCENCEASETSYLKCELPPSSKNQYSPMEEMKSSFAA